MTSPQRTRWFGAFLTVALLIGAGPPAAAITINVQYDATQTGAVMPAFDPTGGQLTAIFNYVAGFYENVFQDIDHTLGITFFYTDLPNNLLGQHTYLTADPNGREGTARIRIDTQNAAGVARNYFFDPTPGDNNEFNMGQVLWRDLTGANQTAWYNAGANVPATFEAGFTGAAIGGTGAVGAMDMLSLVFHEVGHALGMSGANPMTQTEAADGDYDYNSSWIFGGTLAARNPNQPTDFLGHLANPNSLMFPSLAGGTRVLPSHTDLFAMAAGHQYTLLNVPRREFYNPNGNWNTDGNWSGNNTPSNANDVWVRNGAIASLSGFGAAGNLVVDEGAMVSTGANTLFVQNNATIAATGGTGTTRILVGNAGRLRSQLLTVDDGARLDVFGGEVETGRLEILAGGELRGNGEVEITGLFGQLVNDGTIRASGVGTLVITAANNLALDLDGTSNNGDVVATVADIHFQAGLADAFRGTMTIGANRQITFDSSLGIGAGGLVLLDGTTTQPATINTGGVLFVHLNGVLSADGLGVVNSTLVLEAFSFAEASDANSELRFNGLTLLRGGRMVGPGTVRQNGNVLVEQNTTVAVNTYDMDGISGNTTITINPARTLTIMSPNIDTSAANDFDGTLELNGGTLAMAPNWRLDGTMNLTQVLGTTPVVAGPGRITIAPPGEVNVLHSGRINADAVVQGTIKVGDAFTLSELEFHGDTTVTSSATFDIDGLGSVVSFHGPTTLSGGTYAGIGRIAFEDMVNVISNTTIGTAETDLDGAGGNSQITIQPNVTFSIASNTIEPIANDGFDGVITNHGTFSVLAGWRLDGDLEMEQIGAGVPTLEGFGPWRIHTIGTMSSAGDAVINPPAQIAGAMLINGGVTQLNNTASFEATAQVIVGPGAELELNGTTTLAGGSYTGAGDIQFNAASVVNAPTTISVGRVDLDGASNDTHWTLDNSPLVLNVQRIGLTNHVFSGVMDITGPQARLEVNLAPAAGWLLGTAGILNIDADGLPAPTVLAGSPVAALGRINADGRMRFAADLHLHGRLQLIDSGTDVHLGSGGLNTIYNTAIVDGPGSITVDHGTQLFLQDDSHVGVDVENLGRLEVGFQATEVGLDLTQTGRATIRGDYAQGRIGSFGVEVAGLLPQVEHDVLDITGVARLGGTLEVELINGFVPEVGDEVVVLFASSVINEFTHVLAFDSAQQFGVNVSVIYSPTDVTVRFGELFPLPLLGDYNDDGIVDAADFVVWRKNDGTNNVLPNDLIGGLIGQPHYDQWRANFGKVSAGAGSSLAASTNVPEPASLALIALGLAALGGFCRRRD